MKRKLIIAVLFLSLINCSFAQQEYTEENNSVKFFLKSNIGTFTPIYSQPSLSRKDGLQFFSMSTGLLYGKLFKSNIYGGFEIAKFRGILTEHPSSDGDYIFDGVILKSLFHYNICKWFSIQCNFGICSSMCSMKWFYNYNMQNSNIFNLSFVTGYGFNINVLKWLSLNANVDYMDTRINLNYDHIKIKMSTYSNTIGIVIHDSF